MAKRTNTTAQPCAIIGCSNPSDDKHHIYGHGSPMIWVCRQCHAIMHGTTWSPRHGELTRAGLAKARTEGRIGGNPRLRAKDPDAIRKVQESRDAAYMARVTVSLDQWLPIVRRMRPAQPWAKVARVVAGVTGERWTAERLRRTAHRLVAEGMADTTLLAPGPRQPSDARLIRLVAGIAAATPGCTLQQIAGQLEAIQEPTARGGTRWHPASVKHLLQMAAKRFPDLPQPQWLKTRRKAV